MDVVVPARTYFILTIWFSILALPVHLFLDFVFSCILLAPTALEIDNHDRLNFYDSAMKLAETMKKGSEHERFDRKDGGRGMNQAHSGILQSLHSFAKAHLKASKSHLSTRHSKGEKKRLKMLERADRRAKMFEHETDISGEKGAKLPSTHPIRIRTRALALFLAL